MFFSLPHHLRFHNLFKSSWKWGTEKLMSSGEWGCPFKLGYCDCAPFVGETGWGLHDGLKLYFSVFPEILLSSSACTLKVKVNISPNNVYLKWLPCRFTWRPMTDVLTASSSCKYWRKKSHFWKQVPQMDKKWVTNHQVTLIGHQKFVSIPQNGSDAAGVIAFSERSKC